MRPLTPSLFATALLFLTLLAPGALAGEGRLEINQVGIEASGGFPFVIDAPGSYVLTSDLDVPAGVDGLLLATSGVTLDLNGFTIRGPFLCIGGCPPGAGTGIARTPGSAAESSVHDGSIRGFASNCVSLGTQAHVARLMVADCGNNGIAVSSGSLVTHNRVVRTGRHGIAMSGSGFPAAFAHNTVDNAGRNVDEPAVFGGAPTAGNACDDGSCTRVVRPRYYLTQGLFDGDHGAQVCAAGFRMASLGELLNPSALRYDTTLGRTRSDSGGGPPYLSFGWVRNGNSGSGGSLGPANCSPEFGPVPWTSASNLDRGTTAGLEIVPSGGQLFESPDWVVFEQPCNTTHSAWCIED